MVVARSRSRYHRCCCRRSRAASGTSTAVLLVTGATQGSSPRLAEMARRRRHCMDGPVQLMEEAALLRSRASGLDGQGGRRR